MLLYKQANITPLPTGFPRSKQANLSVTCCNYSTQYASYASPPLASTFAWPLQFEENTEVPVGGALWGPLQQRMTYPPTVTACRCGESTVMRKRRRVWQHVLAGARLLQQKSIVVPCDIFVCIVCPSENTQHGFDNSGESVSADSVPF